MTDRGQVKALLRSGIPPELVGRPVSEIDITEGIRSLALATDDSDEITPTQTPRSGTPEEMVTPPGVSTFTMFPERPHQSSEATIKPAIDRPKPRHRARTAPAGQLRLFSGGKPQPPRRAISAITAQAFWRSGSMARRRPPKVSQLSPKELLQLAAKASTSPVNRRKFSRNSVGKMEFKSKPLVWRMSSPPKLYELPPEGSQSFSAKPRVEKTLKSKKVETLKVDVDYGQPRPFSIAPTPRELYGMAMSEVIKAPRGSVAPPRASPRSSTPLRVATPPRSGTLTKRAKQFPSPLSPDAQSRRWRKSMVVESALHNVAPTFPGKRRVYIPGPIQLEEKISPTPRRGSIASMERFDDDTVARDGRFSDIAALDGIIMYFQALGVEEEASEACLDRYWTRNRRCTSRPISSQRSPGKIMAPVPAVPPTPPQGSIATTIEGIFRSQKASRDEKEPPPSPGTPGRRKPLLRQLLKSGRKSG